MEHQSIRVIREEHAALMAMLKSLARALSVGPGNEPENYFDALRAMLFYIDEFPEHSHHPKESALLFPRVVKLAPETQETVLQLDSDHAKGESAVRELQHFLLAWELMGESRHGAFEKATRTYIDFYVGHMQLEESVIIPAALRTFSAQDWRELDAAFGAHGDASRGRYPRNPAYDRLFARIMMHSVVPADHSLR